MKCYFCGAENEEGAVFCEECGKKFFEPEVKPEPMKQAPLKNKCPHCGAENEDNAAFCMACGRNISEPEVKPEPVVRDVPMPAPDHAPRSAAQTQYSYAAAQTATADSGKKQRNIIIAVLAACVVILIIVMIVIIAGSSASQDSSKNNLDITDNNTASLTQLNTYTDNKTDINSLDKNTDNNSGNNSNAISGKLPAPTNIKTETSDSMLVVTWDHVEGSDAYRVYSYEPSVNDYMVFLEITDDGFYASGLFPNTTYTVKIATLKGTSGNYEEQGVTEPISVTTQSSSARSGSSGPEKCWACSGSGDCRVCEGKGEAAYYVGSGAYRYHPACSACGGTGRCVHCGGDGWVD